MPIEFCNNKLYSIEELSEILNISPNTLRIYLRTGKLNGQKVGSKWYVVEKNVMKFLKINNGIKK
jgi:excisionase family DNA binding protein